MLKLLAPANPKELVDRQRWFKKPAARNLARKFGVEYGFELKGSLQEIENAPPLYWGVHLPHALATDWYYHPDKRQQLLSPLKKIAELKPHYAVIHGIHLLWQPPAKNFLQRYENASSPEEHLKVIESTIEFLKELKKIIPTVKIENFPPSNHYQKAGEYLPETYLYTGAGRLMDLLYLRQKSGVDILLDIEHLLITINFLNRHRNYAKIPLKKVENLSESEKKLYQIFGFYLQKGLIPYAEPIDIEDFIKKLQARFYHLTGSVQEVKNGKIVSHAPIKKDDPIFRKHLRLILAQKPEALILETASAGYVKVWDYLRPNETEHSFETLCEILLEEL